MSLKETFSVKEPLRRFQQQFNGHPDAALTNRIRTRDIQSVQKKVDANGCTCTCPSDASFLSSRFGNVGGGGGASSVGGSLPGLAASRFNDDPIVFNMTNASNDPRFRIQDIVHQMFLEVNEEGTEAAAVTTATVDYAATKTFRVDRPFSFFVRHETTLATLFWATIVNPVA